MPDGSLLQASCFPFQVWCPRMAESPFTLSVSPSEFVCLASARTGPYRLRMEKKGGLITPLITTHEPPSKGFGDLGVLGFSGFRFRPSGELGL